MSAIDLVTLAVFRGALDQISDEMDTVLAASAISPVIADAWDRASGVYHPKTGEVVAQGPTGLPIFIVVMQHAVQEVLKDYPSDTMRDGDVFIVNDPYRGGTHTMDVKFVRPLFRDGKVAALVANTGHWPDVGGMTPGGFTPISTDVYQEGLRIPPMRICISGELDRPLVNLLMNNMRAPEDRYGDMIAHISALEIGCRRLNEVFDRFGDDFILDAFEELKQRSAAMMRAYIEQIPDGTYDFQDWLDSDGIVPEPVLIDLKVIVRGSEITFDLSGCAKELRGPFNTPYSSTISGLMIGIKHMFPDVPINAGCFEPFKFIVPEGSMYNPRVPKPVSGTTTEATQRLSCAVMGALGKAMPGRAPAGCFATGSNISLGGKTDKIGNFATIFFWGGGYGGHVDGDGLSNGSNIISAARNSSIEVLEESVPLLFHRHSIREGSAGDGMHRGGFGVEVSFELREGEATLSLVGDRGRNGPHGLEGGLPGAAADHEFVVKGKRFKPEHLTKIGMLELTKGDRVTLRTPGGGGYGEPSKRSSAARKDDIADGYLEKQARPAS